MPTVSRMELGKPKDWQEFEAMVLEAMRLKWGSPNLQKNGRPGQQQEGVDIWGPDYLERPVGIQCKHYKMPLNLNTVVKEVANAERFSGRLAALYIVTSTEHDANLQRRVRSISSDRTGKDKFAVGMMFWEDVIDALLLSEIVFRKFYKNVPLSDYEEPSVRWRLRAALEFGHCASYVSHGANLLRTNNPFAADSESVLNEYKGILHLISFYADFFMPQGICEELKRAVEEITRGLEPNDMGYSHVLGRKSVDFGIVSRNISRYLPDREAHLFSIGNMLGLFADRSPSSSLLQDVYRKISYTLPGADQRIGEEISSIAKGKHPLTWANRLYDAVYEEIWWRHGELR